MPSNDGQPSGLKHFERRARSSVAALAAASVLAFHAADALAFRTTADLDEYGEPAAHWRTSVAFGLHEEGAPGLPFRDVEEAVVRAWQAWERPACSAAEVYNLGSQSSAARPSDGRNTIQWVHDWTERGYEPSAAGVTDVQYERREGEPWAIVEADIYLNAQHFTWRIGGSERDGRDVVSVVTHEIGHALGLLHPCEPDGRDGAPHCDLFPAADGTTMHPAYDAEQATLSPDDEAGICFLYPQETCATLGCPEGLTCTERGWCELLCEPACAENEQCIRGRCVRVRPPTSDGGTPGRGAFGDPCESAAECAGGLCSDGACSVECAQDGDCKALNATCQEGACVSALGGVGQSCSEANQCLGNQCLEIDGDPPVCTRECRADADCPATWSCEKLESRSVCAPLGPLYPVGACALRPARAGSLALPLAGLFVTFVFVLLRRRPRSVRRRSAQPLIRETHLP